MLRIAAVDFLAEISPDQLLHIEFQAHPHGSMAYRMLGYFGNIIERVADDRKLTDAAIERMEIRVRQIVVYAGSKSWKGPDPIDLPNLKFSFEFIDMREQDPEPLLTRGDEGDAVLALLCRNGATHGTIRAILARIAQAPKAKRPDAIARLVALADLRNVRPKIEKEIKEMGMQFNIADSSILREPIDRARKEGYEAGENKGLSKGTARTIVTLLETKFDPEDIPETLADHLSDLQPDVLAAMVKRLERAQSVEDVLGSHMPAQTTGYGP
ncbi:hypothetical protein M2437_002872 [Methylorubrum pseudosasae]|nr:hypothetical protein [Methylorubrum pseudosasae]